MYGFFFVGSRICLWQSFQKCWKRSLTVPSTTPHHSIKLTSAFRKGQRQLFFGTSICGTSRLSSATVDLSAINGYHEPLSTSILPLWILRITSRLSASVNQQPLSTILNYHQPSSSHVNHYQPLPTTTNHYQPLPTTIADLLHLSPPTSTTAGPQKYRLTKHSRTRSTGGVRAFAAASAGPWINDQAPAADATCK